MPPQKPLQSKQPVGVVWSHPTPFWVIIHPIQGYYTGHKSTYSHSKPEAHFSWPKGNAYNENVCKYYSIGAAHEAISSKYLPFPPKVFPRAYPPETTIYPPTQKE